LDNLWEEFRSTRSQVPVAGHAPAGGAIAPVDEPAAVNDRAAWELGTAL
jgi:hypothetical protein